jgi:hypothetical protein
MQIIDGYYFEVTKPVLSHREVDKRALLTSYPCAKSETFKLTSAPAGIHLAALLLDVPRPQLAAAHAHGGEAGENRGSSKAREGSDHVSGDRAGGAADYIVTTGLDVFPPIICQGNNRSSGRSNDVFQTRPGPVKTA